MTGLYDDYALWHFLYDGMTIFNVNEIRSFRDTNIDIVEQPKPLTELAGAIEDFWGAWQQDHDDWNGVKYGMQGLNDVKVGRSSLTVRAFLTNFAVLKFSIPQNRKAVGMDISLTEDQGKILSTLYTLGSSSCTLSHAEDRYLTGVKKIGQMKGLLELMPMGFVEPATETSNVFYKALEREFREETSLDLSKDASDVQVTHIALSSLGVFELLHRIILKNYILDENLMPEDPTHPEHQEIRFRDAIQLRQIQLHRYEPSSAAFLVAMGIL